MQKTSHTPTMGLVVDGNDAVCTWHDAADENSINACYNLLDTAVASGTPLIYISVMEETSSAPGPFLVALITKRLRRLEAGLQCCAIVLEGDPKTTASSRFVLAQLLLKFPFAFPKKVFATADEAVEWVATLALKGFDRAKLESSIKRSRQRQGSAAG
jgi:hypothetical protein